MGVVYAHQGGWDEILLVLGPIAVMAALVAIAQRKARRLGPHHPENAENGSSASVEPLDTGTE
jgi:hypothetical protein